ncbi:MAG: hypothetical protein POELPBGB_02924 [Bacteroidia bacterium]|nr:hypothetical protein [Bacteroidia bacterium]
MPILILKLGYLKTLQILSSSSYSHNDFNFIHATINNRWADAMIDIYIQFTISFSIFLLIIYKSIVFIIENKTDKNMRLHFIIFGITAITCTSLFLSGIFISPYQILLFKLNSDTRLTFSSMHLPPFQSALFIFRFFLSIYGVYLTYVITYLVSKPRE